MITAVRLQQRNPKRGFNMRSYVSANSQSRYRSGDGVTPSPWKVIEDPMELAELAGYPQFERKDFDTLAELEEFVQVEMEQGARLGFPPVRAAIEVPRKKVRPPRDLRPVVLDEEPDPDPGEEPGPTEEPEPDQAEPETFEPPEPKLEPEPEPEPDEEWDADNGPDPEDEPKTEQPPPKKRWTPPKKKSQKKGGGGSKKKKKK